MPFGSSVIPKPIIFFIWFYILVTLVVFFFRGYLSFEEAILRGLVVTGLWAAWTIGLHQYIFPFLNPGSRIIVPIQGFLFRIISSFWYIPVFSIIFFFDDTRVSKAQTLVVLSIMSLVWAYILFRRIRLLEDTAHSSLNSAAQGYAVLQGKVSLYHNEVIRSPHRDLPVMVWFRKYLFTSAAGFLLSDDKGMCTVDPRDAEVITPRYHYGSHSYSAIYPNEKIYVLGQLETLSKQRNEYERKVLISSKIIEWKRHPIRFLTYFDRDNDGHISDTEMATVRDAAERTVDDSLEEIYQEPATHVVSNPKDGRPFLIISIHPDVLLERYKTALYLHLFIWVSFSVYALAMQV